MSSSHLLILPEEQTDAASLYLSTLRSGDSRRTQRTALTAIVRRFSQTTDIASFGWESLRHEHVLAVRAWLAERYAPATANRILAALRGVLRASWRLGRITFDDYRRMVDVPIIRGARLPAGRALLMDELAALFQFANADKNRWRGARDAGLLGLLYGAGLRRHEVCLLKLEDLIRQETGLSVRVMGKGNKQRLVPLPEEVSDALQGWLLFRGAIPGTLFYARTQLGLPRAGVPMRVKQVAFALKQLARRANTAHVAPHDCRRSYITHLLDAGADLSTVQALAGHANVETTIRYDRRGDHAKRKAARLLPVPFVRQFAQQ